MAGTGVAHRKLHHAYRMDSADYRLKLFAFFRLSENDAVTMMPPGVVGLFPSWIGDRTLADVDDAIATREPNRNGSIYQFDVGPLKLVAMNIVRDHAKKRSVISHAAISFIPRLRV